MVPTDDVAPIPASCLKYIRRIQNYCEAHGAKLVFLSAPNALSWDYAQHNAIAALAKELDIDYLDANLHNDQIGIDWSHDTCDHGDHLNHAGAVKNTRFLEKCPVLSKLTAKGALFGGFGAVSMLYWRK